MEEIVLMTIEEIETNLKRSQVNSDWEITNNTYCYHVEFLLSEVKRLEHELEISEACTSYLKTDIEILKQGIEKHRDRNDSDALKWNVNDEELYKLLEDK